MCHQGLVSAYHYGVFASRLGAQRHHATLASPGFGSGPSVWFAFCSCCLLLQYHSHETGIPQKAGFKCPWLAHIPRSTWLAMIPVRTEVALSC
jgi:hypothetical protein